MEEIIQALKTLHDELKDGRPKDDKLGAGAGYRNGYEDGYKLVSKRIKIFIDDLSSEGA